MKKITSLLAIGFASLGIQSASHGAVITNWVAWDNPGSFPYADTNAWYNYNYATSANGTIALPAGGSVGVSLTGEVAGGSAFGQSSNAVWSTSNAEGSTFLSANVPQLPPNGDYINLEGWDYPTQTLTFSNPVSNLVMNVISMGSSGNMGSYQFNNPFVILSQNGLLSKVGNELRGNEGHGTIQFTGVFSSLSWSVSSPEGSFYNIGVTSAAAPGSAAVPEPGQVAASLLLLGGIGGYVFLKRRKAAQSTEPAVA